VLSDDNDLPVFNRNKNLSQFNISELFKECETFFLFHCRHLWVSLFNIVIFEDFAIKKLIREANLLGVAILT